MHEKLELLIVDHNEATIRELVTHINRRIGWRTCASVHDMLKQLANVVPDVVVIGSFSGGLGDLIEAANQVRARAPAAAVVLVPDRSCEALAIQALRAGVREYIPGPVPARDVAEVVNRLLPPVDNVFPCDELIGSSSSIRSVRELIFRFAPTNSTVLITGETGVGKDVVARLLHKHSNRAAGPFVCVNCAAIPDTLLESELFGFEKGAFTGALSRHAGQLRLAEGGTVLLDEIGDMSPTAQTKLLRAIETREVQPLGASRPVPVNIRIVAATHRDLAALNRLGRFRSDLFYRLSVARIQVPSLRERSTDIPQLALHFLGRTASSTNRPLSGFTPAAMRRLVDFNWPGNCRQLKNAVESAALMSNTGWITESDLTHFQVQTAGGQTLLARESIGGVAIDEVTESEQLLRVLDATNWNKKRAAELLQWSRMTLYRKIAKHQLTRETRRSHTSSVKLKAVGDAF